MRDLAQTNLQLYQQVLELGWSEPDLAKLRASYDLACQLFTARYRASGKTFVSHLVGTASAVAAADGRPHVVTAALLHAAYQQGDFGPRLSLEQCRVKVRSSVGARVEDLVSAYAQSPWDPAVIQELLGHTAGLDASTRDVLLIRLANEVDEHADRGTHFADRNGAALYSNAAVDDMADIAIELGYRDLAEGLNRFRARDVQPPIPLVLRSSAGGSFVRPAASSTLRLRAQATVVWAHLARELKALPVVSALYRRFRALGEQTRQGEAR